MSHVTIYAAGFAPANPHAYSLFMAVDRDRSGSVSLPELHHALTHGGYVSFSIKTARLLLRMYDADRSGSLSYFEFERLLGQLTQWKGFFDAHTAGTGRLSPGGLAAIVAASGFALPPPVVHMMFYAYDENASGTLSFVSCGAPPQTRRGAPSSRAPRPKAPRSPPRRAPSALPLTLAPPQKRALPALAGRVHSGPQRADHPHRRLSAARPQQLRARHAGLFHVFGACFRVPLVKRMGSKDK